MTAFAWRLGLIAFAALHYSSFADSLHEGSGGLPGTLAIVWEQAGMFYAVSSATWPFSKSFVKSFDTSPLVGVTMTGSSKNHYGTGEGTAGTTKTEEPVTRDVENLRYRMRMDKFRHTARASASGKVENEDSNSFGSQEMIIRRDDTVDISFEDGPVNRA
ncbi:hypothetical protein LTR86_000317 [Recurvomyces mirabilis]|nr:hypothetical protein LTR86_000317 [Recurvomyces mirabilis]